MPLMLFPDEDGSPEFNNYKKFNFGPKDIFPRNKDGSIKYPSDTRLWTQEMQDAWKRQVMDAPYNATSGYEQNNVYDNLKRPFTARNFGNRPDAEWSAIQMMTPEERAKLLRSNLQLPANIAKPPAPPEMGFSAFPTEDGKPLYMQEYQGGYAKGNYPNEYIKKMPSNHFGEWDAVAHERVFDKTSATTSYFKQKGPNSYQPMWRNAANGGSAVTGLSKANLFLGAALVPAQIADQASAAAGWDGDNTLDREYGRSDPLSIRPNIDAFLDTPPYDLGASFGMPYTRQGKAAKAAYSARVNDPEYIYRNPMSSMVGQAARGNMDYAKAFANEYLPQGYQFNYSDSPSNRERVGLYKR